MKNRSRLISESPSKKVIVNKINHWSKLANMVKYKFLMQKLKQNIKNEAIKSNGYYSKNYCPSNAMTAKRKPAQILLSEIKRTNTINDYKNIQLIKLYDNNSSMETI